MVGVSLGAELSSGLYFSVEDEAENVRSWCWGTGFMLPLLMVLYRAVLSK